MFFFSSLPHQRICTGDRLRCPQHSREWLGGWVSRQPPPVCLSVPLPQRSMSAGLEACLPVFRESNGSGAARLPPRSRQHSPATGDCIQSQGGRSSQHSQRWAVSEADRRVVLHISLGALWRRTCASPVHVMRYCIPPDSLWKGSSCGYARADRTDPHSSKVCRLHRSFPESTSSDAHCRGACGLGCTIDSGFLASVDS